MSEFWNDRYATESYVYGTEPNLFFREQLKNLVPGKILFPAEGEGRNAVYAAEKGWDVTAFDSSTEARKKAENLALLRGVRLHYLTTDYENAVFRPESFDCIVLIYAHMHPAFRRSSHQKLATFLKPGGALILEGFSKKQILNSTGGPRNVQMLFSEEELRADFGTFTELNIAETEIQLEEGLHHQGPASVIRLAGIK